MSLRGVHHVALTVAQLARSATWYSRVLGWEHIWTSEDETPQCCVGSPPDGTFLCFGPMAASSVP